MSASTRTKFTLGLILNILLNVFAYGQTDSAQDFVIGMFGFELTNVPHTGDWCAQLNAQVDTHQTNYAGMATSQLRMLKADGFSHVYNYQPATWNYGLSYQRSLLQLINSYGLKTVVHARDFYHPKGFNIYDNRVDDSEHAQNSNYLCKVRPNYTELITQLYRNHPAVWGLQVTEEASYYHPFNPLKRATVFDAPENTFTEVPPVFVDSALRYFKATFAPAPCPKRIIMEAVHHKVLHDNTKDAQGKYNPQDYLKLRPDVYFEGSYVQFPPKRWVLQKYDHLKGYNYLGKFLSIEFAKNYCNEIHSVINIEAQNSQWDYRYHYHSDTAVPNANWLYCQAYLSIIHGAKGVWFWELNGSWQKNEKPQNWAKLPDRFTPRRMPQYYREYIAPLARQLDYLKQAGFLNSSPLALKTDKADTNQIIPQATTYITDSCFKANKIKKRFRKHFRNENYGIRYAIFQNEKGQKLLLLVNPLPLALNVPINLPKGKKMELLFETQKEQEPTAYYKVNRKELSPNHSLPPTYTLTSTHPSLYFAPLDVKMIRYE